MSQWGREESSVFEVNKRGEGEISPQMGRDWGGCKRVTRTHLHYQCPAEEAGPVGEKALGDLERLDSRSRGFIKSPM